LGGELTEEVPEDSSEEAASQNEDDLLGDLDDLGYKKYSLDVVFILQLVVG
jgi:hypothetical protein